MCFFGDLYCTELHIKVNFEYRIKIWYRLVSKNSGIEPALFLLHTVLLLGTVFYVNIILTTLVSNKIQVSIGIEQNLVSNQHY